MNDPAPQLFSSYGRSYLSQFNNNPLVKGCTIILMPAFLEKRLKAEYPGNPPAVFGTLNKIGAMKGNKITAKGKRMEKKHDRDVKMGKIR